MSSPYYTAGYLWFPSPPDEYGGFTEMSPTIQNSFRRGWDSAQSEANDKYDFDVSLCGTPSQIIDFHENNLEALDFEQFKKVTFAILAKMNERLENL